MSNTLSNSVSSPSSLSSSAAIIPQSIDISIPSDDEINDALISSFNLTSEGGFIARDIRNIDSREKDGVIQVRLTIGESAFWMDAKDISIRLNRMQHNRIFSQRSFYQVSSVNGKFRCSQRIKTKYTTQLEQYQQMHTPNMERV